MNHVVDFIRTGKAYLTTVGFRMGRKEALAEERTLIFLEKICKYPCLVELLHETFEVYHLLTGHKVEHDNHEPRLNSGN